MIVYDHSTSAEHAGLFEPFFSERAQHVDTLSNIKAFYTTGGNRRTPMFIRLASESECLITEVVTTTELLKLRTIKNNIEALAYFTFYLKNLFSDFVDKLSPERRETANRLINGTFNRFLDQTCKKEEPLIYTDLPIVAKHLYTVLRKHIS